MDKIELWYEIDGLKAMNKRLPRANLKVLEKMETPEIDAWLNNLNKALQAHQISVPGYKLKAHLEIFFEPEEKGLTDKKSEKG